MSKEKISHSNFKTAPHKPHSHPAKPSSPTPKELGVRPVDLSGWKGKHVPGVPQPSRSPFTQVRAENQALRNEMLLLKEQWEGIKANLGIAKNPPPTEKEKGK